MELIQTEEGRALPNSGNYVYEYFLKDHLGNTRLTEKSDGNIYQLQDYYAFGMDIPASTPTTPDNRYKYNGKEYETEMALNEYDYGARFYDPVLGRWTSVDPKAEKYYGLSGYVYGNDMPASLGDLDGKDVDPRGLSNDKTKKALVKLLATKEGKNFVNQYLKKGQSFTIVVGGKKITYTNTSDKDGKYASNTLRIGDQKYIDGNTSFFQKDGRTGVSDPTDGGGQNVGPYDIRKGTVTDITINSDAEVDEAAAALGHEAFDHADPGAARLDELKQELNSGLVKPGSPEYAAKLDLINQEAQDHKREINDQVPSLINYFQELNLIDHTTKFSKLYEEQKKRIAGKN